MLFWNWNVANFSADTNLSDSRWITFAWFFLFIYLLINKFIYLFLSFQQPRKRRRRTTWRTCSAGRWKPCKHSLPHFVPVQRRGTRGSRWNELLSVFCVFEENWQSTLCNTTDEQQCCTLYFFCPPPHYHPHTQMQRSPPPREGLWRWSSVDFTLLRATCLHLTLTVWTLVVLKPVWSISERSRVLVASLVVWENFHQR